MSTLTLVDNEDFPKVFEVFFFVGTEGGSLQDRLFNFANKLYHKAYDFNGTILHLAVRLGKYVYEVTEDGTVKYLWSPELLDNERIVGLFTADITKLESDKIRAAQFTLENCLGRKLDIPGSLKYLWNTIGFGKSEDQLLRIATSATQDMINLPTATYLSKGRKSRFHLPYTCATLVNITLNRLIDYEPGFAGHLAQSSALTLTLLSEFGFGSIYDLDANEWLIT